MRYRPGLITIGVLGAYVAWCARPIVAARRIGIPWRFTLGQSYCRRTAVDVYCTSDWPPTPDLPAEATVSIQPWTRELLRADRTWRLTDSTAWARLSDSAQRSLSAHGWESLPCDPAATHFETAEAWRVGDHEIRFYASPRIRASQGESRYYANVQLVALGASACGPRYVHRLMTPAEMARAVREWLASTLGL